MRPLIHAAINTLTLTHADSPSFSLAGVDAAASHHTVCVDDEGLC